MSVTVRRWAFLILIIIGTLLLDQLSKQLILQNLQLYESFQPLPAIADYFQIVHSRNTGSAFGFMAGVPFAGYVFLVLAVGVSGVLVWSYPRLENGQRIGRLATALVIGGALGNAIDRVLYGHVVDFINYQLPGVISNVSNLADHAIVLGVGLMIWSNWKEIQPEPDVDKGEANQEMPI